MKSQNLLKKFVGWLDPKLEKYREKKEIKYIPKNLEDLVGVLGRTPEAILSAKEKNIIASVVNLGVRKVSDLMVLKDDMIFIKDDELLGPLNLDKLYKSGFSVFPVVNKKDAIVGVIKTNSLNSLEIKEAKSAKKLMIKDQICYVGEQATIADIVDKFLATNCLLYIVKNESDEIVGMLTFDIVIYYLLGRI